MIATVMSQLKAERTMALLQSALSARGIEVIVLKGPHLGNVYYPDASERPYCDLDVLVRRTQLAEALDALIGVGFSLLPRTAERSYTDSVQYSEHLLSPNRTQIDLHHSFAAYGRYPVDTDAMFARSVPFMFGRVPTRGLEATDLLASLCLHIAHSYFQVQRKHFKDLALVINRGGVDWTRFCRTTRMAGCTRGTYYALLAAMGLEGAVVPSRVIDELRPGLIWRRYFEAIIDPRVFPVVQRPATRTGLQWALALPLMDHVSSWPAKLAYYGALRLADWWTKP